jgi:hypothetical protein
MWEKMMAEQAEIARQKKEAEKQQKSQPRTTSPSTVAAPAAAQVGRACVCTER